jgi:hypothetical protein
VTSGLEERLRRATVATLAWTVPVRLIEVSRAGCRLESARALETGVSGRLRLTLGGRVHEDDVRVARCLLKEGAGQNFVVGAELLRTRPLNARTIRLAISDLLDTHDSSGLGSPADAGLRFPDRESELLAKGASRAPPADLNKDRWP